MTEHKRLTTKEKYPHGAEGVSKDKLTGKYCRGVFEATACVEKLAEYETAEEEGRLVVLPCKVGDTVYEIRSDYTKCSVCGDKFNEYECQGCEHECDSRKIYTIYEYTMYILEDIVQHIRCNNWGKTIFTTREEAEKALKEMEGK